MCRFRRVALTDRPQVVRRLNKVSTRTLHGCCLSPDLYALYTWLCFHLGQQYHNSICRWHDRSWSDQRWLWLIMQKTDKILVREEDNDPVLIIDKNRTSFGLSWSGLTVTSLKAFTSQGTWARSKTLWQQWRHHSRDRPARRTTEDALRSFPLAASLWGLEMPPGLRDNLLDESWNLRRQWAPPRTQCTHSSAGGNLSLSCQFCCTG